MLTLFLATLALGASTQNTPANVPVEQLSAYLDSAQPELRDFRCEYEGSIYYIDPKLQAMRKLGGDGLAERFNGRFIWSDRGRTLYDAFRREEPGKTLLKERMVVRGDEAETYLRPEDSPMGGAIVEDTRITNADRPWSYGSMFLRDTIQRMLKDPMYRAGVASEVLDGRTCLVVSFNRTDNGELEHKFWLDPGRGGHVCLRENYRPGGKVLYRLKVTLGQFPWGTKTFWMPSSASLQSTSMTKPPSADFESSPWTRCDSYVVRNTMAFNQNPSDSVFKADYRPGTPVSDQVRQAYYEHGQQKPRSFTRAEAEAHLRDQIAQAKAQGRELEGGVAEGRFDWGLISAWIFGGLCLIGSLMLWRSRRANR